MCTSDYTYASLCAWYTCSRVFNATATWIGKAHGKSASRTKAKVNNRHCCSSNRSGERRQIVLCTRVWGRQWTTDDVRVRARGSINRRKGRVTVDNLDGQVPRSWCDKACHGWVGFFFHFYAPAPVVPPARAEERIPGD